MLVALLLACLEDPRPKLRPDPVTPSGAALGEVPSGPRLARDLDHDGVSVADGDCDDLSAEVGPAAAEVCNGVDDDCDGQIDQHDGSVDIYSCGFCSDPATFDETRLDWLYTNPCELDPAATCSNHIHRRVERIDGHPFRDELLLFLPPGPGAWNETILQWGAWAGFRVLSLGWLNDDHKAECQGDAQCVLDLRYEQMYGVDTSPWMDVAPNDAIVGRLETLLRALVALEPGEGWDRYWTEADGVRWQNIVVFGWSWGAGQTAFVAQHHEVAGALMISGPEPAAWLVEPSATPACRKYALYHELDELGEDGGDLPAMLAAMGLGTPVDSDTVPPPYGDAQILTTIRTDFQIGDCGYHSATAYDGCVSEALAEPYAYLFCSAADTPLCSE